MPDLSLAGNYTPELDASVFSSLKKKRQERTRGDLASVRKQAVERGLTGSPYEALGSAATQNAEAADLDEQETRLALEGSQRAREDRMKGEDRSFSSSEAEKARLASSNEAEKQRIFSSGESQKTRDAEASNLREGYLASAGGTMLGRWLGGGGRDGGFGMGEGGGEGGGGGGLLGGLGGLLKPGGVGSLFKGPAMANVGRLALNAGAAYGGAKIARGLGITGQSGSKGINRGQKAGSVAGGAIGSILGGGPLGAAAGSFLGGAAGGSIAKIAESKPVAAVSKALKKICFEAGTLVQMVDGTKKWILNLGIGEETLGGTVVSVRQSICEAGTLYNYKGVFVTGSHAVFENGMWIRVEDSPYSKRMELGTIVYSIVTTKHRIYAYGDEGNLIKFADEFETDEYMDLDMEESLKALNDQDSKLLSDAPPMLNHVMPD